MIAGLLLLLVLPLVMASVVYALRRWASLSALLAVGMTLVLGLLTAVLPFDRSLWLFGREISMGDPVTFLGRELILERSDQLALVFLFFTAAGIMALAWRVSPQALLFPIGLGLLSLLIGTLLIRPLIYGALLLGIASALSIFALQIEGHPPSQGGLRYLTFAILALPGLLVTHWLMDRYALTPDNTSLLDAASILLTISFALLLGSVPFHTWVPAVADDSDPLASAFVFTINNAVIWLLLLDFLETYPELSDYRNFSNLVSTAGIAMVVLGGLLAPAQRRLGRLMGYGALIDTGGALLALGINSETGVSLVLLSLLMRPFGLVLMATGLSSLKAHNGGQDGFDALQGVGRLAPWSTAALVMGGLSTAGFPVSAGFTWRWALYRAISTSGPGAALLLLLAGGGLIVGIWRSLSALLARHPQTAEDEESPPESSQEGWLTAVFVGVAVAACIGIGFFPQVLAPIATRMAGTYTFFAP